MRFQPRAADGATLSHFFGRAGIGKAVAVAVVAGDEDGFIAQAARAGVPISFVIDTPVHADHLSGGPPLAQRTGAPWFVVPDSLPQAAGTARRVAANLRCHAGFARPF